MELEAAIRSRIEAILQSDRVVLFMKGTPAQPQCGFSAKTTKMLNMLLPEYATFDVMADSDIREGIKSFANWPTIPQLYIDRELMGGCDIVTDLFEQRELHELLGIQIPPRTVPKIDLTEQASAKLKEALATQPEKYLWLTVDARWMIELTFGPDDDTAIKAEASGIDFIMDPISAERANGLKIDVKETLQGPSFNCENPNAPPPVQQIVPKALNEIIQSGDNVHLFDVRPEVERAQAKIKGARPLDQPGEQLTEIERLEKDAVLIFHCHLGGRSQTVADRFRLRGFTNIYNLQGGIDAWSLEVDPSVPRY